MENNSLEIFKESLQKLLDLREKMLDMYNNTLYEDTWTDATIREFEKCLKEYKIHIDDMEDNINNIEWVNPEYRDKFLDRYENVLKKDYESYRLTMVRHNAYLNYRTNRKSLIKKICKIGGYVKSKGGKNNMEVFNYFNDKCAKMPLYDNRENGYVTANKRESLSEWFYENIRSIVDDVNDDISTESTYDGSEVTKIFKAYVNCRKRVFAIFNMMTSSNKLNGYERWHNALDRFCQAQLNDKEMEKLFDAADAENDFIETDDYQQELDDRSWNMKGVYEFGFDDAIRRARGKHALNEHWIDDAILHYNRHVASKDDVVKINMLSVDANACKVTLDGNHVFSSVGFFPGDIIEKCPTRPIDKSALYSKDMREIAFEVVPNTEWVVPFGYCQFYDYTYNKADSNCEFFWDATRKLILIIANKRIRRHEKLILQILK